MKSGRLALTIIIVSLGVLMIIFSIDEIATSSNPTLFIAILIVIAILFLKSYLKDKP